MRYLVTVKLTLLAGGGGGGGGVKQLAPLSSSAIFGCVRNRQNEFLMSMLVHSYKVTKLDTLNSILCPLYILIYLHFEINHHFFISPF